MFQTKDQDKNPRRQISEVEIEDLPENVFTVMIIKMNSGKKKRRHRPSRYKKCITKS